MLASSWSSRCEPGGEVAVPLDPFLPPTRSRRHWLAQAGGGFGAIAFSALAAGEARSSTAGVISPFAPKKPHHTPRAKRVISLFMHGGPSHVDLFDPKPELVKYAGKPIPESYGEVMTRRKVARNPLLGPVRPFRPRGASGLEVSDFLPHMATIADDLCVVRSCHGDSVNHPQSVYQMNTGSILMGRPSVGSWVAYGLGAENQNMPAFLVLPDPEAASRGDRPPGEAAICRRPIREQHSGRGPRRSCILSPRRASAPTGSSRHSN